MDKQIDGRLVGWCVDHQPIYNYIRRDTGGFQDTMIDYKTFMGIRSKTIRTKYEH